MEQLKPGGRLIVPVGPEGGEQHLTQVYFVVHLQITEIVLFHSQN